MIYQGDSTNALPVIGRRYRTIFMDPPDNLGLKYDSYVDRIPETLYYSWVTKLVLDACEYASCVWVSYYWRHDFEIKGTLWPLFNRLHPAWTAKSFVWRYTFGQHRDSDFGSGHRYLLRLHSPSWSPDTSRVRVRSARQKLGDKRAKAGGRVPDDVWDFDADAPDGCKFCGWAASGVLDAPRVTGNSGERRRWHPTQHPERLMERILLSSGGPVLDLFGGTGTTLRVAKRLGLDCDIVELDAGYCAAIAMETDSEITILE